MFDLSIRSRLLPLVLLPVLLASCSGGDHEAPPVREETTPEFSQADKVAAQTLSLGSANLPASADQDPYSKTLLCHNALEVLVTRIRSATTLSDEQSQAIDQAQALYERRLQAQALQVGKSSSEIREDLQKVQEEYPDAGANARMAIGCLRDLAQAS